MNTTTTSSLNGQETLDLAYDQLEAALPKRAARALAWLRRPEARWVRIPAGLLCIAAAFFWFMPIIGIEWAPVGLLLLAQDIPFLRRPVGLLILALLAAWRHLRHWWRRRRAR
ncbi:hypothetical protein [Roseateles asaccharophilus]|uniref:Transmembrane protein n=1 Tax=Roseateles asaccharophilus TaxID=582607 RepID=A0ABU2A5H7_9BURK|nr:hypothetical protein [Roseateles asaccharophilus]MDR7331308.1 hypothetical protein [Roseateles asaccharophilus]